MTTKASSPGPVALCFLLHGCSELPWLLLALTSASASPMGSESTPPGVSLQISFLFSVIHFGVCVPSEPSLLHPPPDWGGGVDTLPLPPRIHSQGLTHSLTDSWPLTGAEGYDLLEAG